MYENHPVNGRTLSRPRVGRNDSGKQPLLMNREDCWDIKGPGPACAACSRRFTDGQKILSRLDQGQGGYYRTDFCIGCARDEHRQNAISVWTGTYRPPVPSRPTVVPREVAESLLRRLIQQCDTADPEVSFVLAIMLERKKVLAEREIQRRDSLKILVYEHRRTGEVFIVPDPQLTVDRLESVGRRVSVLLEEEAARLAADPRGRLPTSLG